MSTAPDLLSNPPPALPPKPSLSVETAATTNGAGSTYQDPDLMDDQDELESPGLNRLTAHQMVGSDDPYASLAGLSDEFGGGLGKAMKEDEANRAILS